MTFLDILFSKPRKCWPIRNRAFNEYFQIVWNRNGVVKHMPIPVLTPLVCI